MFAYSASFGALLLELRPTKETAKFVAGVVFEIRSVLGIRNRLITCDSARGDEAEMRHRCGFNRLGRDIRHRKALLKNLATALIKHERIVTTLAKAKELRKAGDRVSCWCALFRNINIYASSYFR